MTPDRDILLLRLEAPLMSFGGPLTDALGRTSEMPQRSMLAGLLANALGWDHRDHARTERLQARIRYAARQDAPGELLVDYHTVDLGQPAMRDTGWTTRGVAESRGGASGEGTHIRLREFLADASYLVALCLEPADEVPTLDEVAAAVRAPERPVFLGRKCCLPSKPLFEGRVRGSLYEVLRTTPLARPSAKPVKAWWSETDGPAEGREVPVYDARDWRNQVHVGRRYVRESTLTVEARR